VYRREVGHLSSFYENDTPYQPRDTVRYGKTNNTIAVWLKCFAWLEIVCSIIMGFVMSKAEVYEFFGYGYEDRVWGVAFVWWVSGIFGGIVLLGFAEIIQILHDMRERQYAKKE
jgi:hypothetical protein